MSYKPERGERALRAERTVPGRRGRKKKTIATQHDICRLFLSKTSLERKVKESIWGSLAHPAGERDIEGFQQTGLNAGEKKTCVVSTSGVQRRRNGRVSGTEVSTLLGGGITSVAILQSKALVRGGLDSAGWRLSYF